jgi:hypothetical protein
MQRWKRKVSWIALALVTAGVGYFLATFDNRLKRVLTVGRCSFVLPTADHSSGIPDTVIAQGMAAALQQAGWNPNVWETLPPPGRTNGPPCALMNGAYIMRRSAQRLSAWVHIRNKVDHQSLGVGIDQNPASNSLVYVIHRFK